MEDNQNKKGNIWGLLPMVVFLVLFLGTGIITKDFSSMPINIAFLMAGIVAVLMNKNKNIEEKVEIFCRGAGESNIIMMTLVFIMTGIFANVAIDMGAVEAIVNFGLSVLLGSALVAGLFVISSFKAISIEIGRAHV